jgi:hypothetical protein
MLMGRERSAYWTSRRSAAARHDSPRTFVPRLYAFDARVRIGGETGPACLERIEKPLKSCPKATTRVIARWQGELPRGAKIDTGSGELVVLRVFPMSQRVRVAHFLCASAETAPTEK